jgi:hypothetical protein
MVLKKIIRIMLLLVITRASNNLFGMELGKQQEIDLESQVVSRAPKILEMQRTEKIIVNQEDFPKQTSCCEIFCMAAPAIFCGGGVAVYTFASGEFSDPISISDFAEGLSTASLIGALAGKFGFETFENCINKKNN